jgi:hypothetical protein
LAASSAACAPQFVALCRDMGLLTKASVAIDRSKFKAVNNRNFTRAKVDRRRAQLEESVARYPCRTTSMKFGEYPAEKAPTPDSKICWIEGALSITGTISRRRSKKKH